VLVVDSSVWIDFFAGRPNPQRGVLRRLLDAGDVPIVVPDLVLYEVLRGFRDESGLRQARRLMESLTLESAGGIELAREAAQHYRSLRQAGVTVRSSVDVLIAAFCIDRDYLLLHNDRDYDAFAQHRGLRVWSQ
jgi:predicted nucleic acid-binding protein